MSKFGAHIVVVRTRGRADFPGIGGAVRRGASLRSRGTFAQGRGV